VQFLLFLSAGVLTLVLGNYFVRYMGWWAICPAVILGFGLVVILIVGLDRVFLRRQPNDVKRSDQDFEP
jgi:hypothetical protein